MSDDDDDLSKSVTFGSGGENSQIEVYGRIRPSPKNDATVCQLDSSAHSIEFRLPRDYATSGYINNKKELYDFKMTHIFNEKSTQSDIFEGIGKKVVMNVLD